MRLDEQNKIDVIMDNFNFNAVEKTMKALKWKWALPGEEKRRVPNLAEIKAKAREMLKDAVKGNCYATAGFKTEKYDAGNISLSFIVEEYDSFYHSI